MLLTYTNSKHFAYLLLFPILFGCSKRIRDEKPTQATIQVFNALDNGEHIFVNLSGKRPVQFRTLARFNNHEFFVNRSLIYTQDIASPLDIFTLTDTLPHQPPAISTTLELKPGSIYSLFIYGEKSTAAWSLFNDAIPPINRQDSTTHVRFANFSESQAISVNIKDSLPGSLIQHLPYKSLSGFTELEATVAVAGYTFEIRNQQTGVLLATYTTPNFHSTKLAATQWLAKSNTLVFTGRPLAASPNNQKITLMNHR